MPAVDFDVIINMFAMEGMVALGKMKHPATDTLSTNTEQAKFIIDILGVLSEKTKGNLTESESRSLEYVLANLRLNYVQESNASGSVISTPDAPDDSNLA
ncbi:MAG: DUF1844 domain-containing protein [Candidatus Kapabacteria bacterium]|nr:DUF1844 domain-containing protein [Candidatus Kapabacteria bacterium]